MKKITLFMALLVISVVGLTGIRDASAMDSPGLVTTAEQLLNAATSANTVVITLQNDISLSDPLVFSGWGNNAVLDLNGRRLNIAVQNSSAIRINGWNGSLTVRDSVGGGKLLAQCLYNGMAESGEDTAAIRVLDTAQTIIIDGADITAIGGSFGPGIGASASNPGSIVIKSGDVTATGGIGAAALGGGYRRLSGDISIEGGNVHATGGEYAAGIGTGGFSSITPNTDGRINQILISGGNVYASGGSHGAGIGGGQMQTANTSITGGNVQAFGGVSGAGVGSGKFNIIGAKKAGDESSILTDSRISITGGNLKATGGDFAAGIGTGEGLSNLETEADIGVRRITVSGANVLAIGGRDGAGIGGGAYMSGGYVEISRSSGANTVVESFGGEFASGIGGGKGGVTGKQIDISGGDIYAYGGEYAAGIGSGEFSLEHLEPTSADFQNSKQICISGGTVYAFGGADAAAIGGGKGGSGSYLTVSGSPVIDAVSKFETAIGAGKYSYDHGGVIIDGGNIKTNNAIGSLPKNSKGQNLYPGVVEVVSKNNNPVGGAMIDALIDDSTIYSANTDQSGLAYIYLPGETTPIDIKAGTGHKGFESVDFIEFHKENEAVATFRVEGYDSLKILSSEYTYYMDSRDNAFPLDYSGGIPGRRSFDIINNDCNMSIDSSTGVLTIPVNIKPGDYKFTVNAFEDGKLADSQPFVLHVRQKLLDLIPNITEAVIKPGEDIRLSVSTRPHNAEIITVNWKVTGETDNDYELVDLSGRTGETEAIFNASRAGEYIITVSAKDADLNQATQNILVSVAPLEDTVAVFAGRSGRNDILPDIVAWDSARLNESQAQIIIDANKNGVLSYRLAAGGQNPNDSYTEGFTIHEGYNTLQVDGLVGHTGYNIYAKLADDSGNESLERLMMVPPLERSDILPPVLTDIIAKREDAANGFITFTSDEAGRYRYASTPDADAGVYALKYSFEPFDLSSGANRLELGGFKSAEELYVYLSYEDKSGNRAEPIRVALPAYKDPDAIAPKLSTGWAVRYSQDTAAVGFTSDIPGEYYYATVLEGELPPRIDTSGHGMAATRRGNTVYLDDLPDERAYDVYILCKDAQSGEASELFKVSVEAFVPEKEMPPVLTAGDAIRKGTESAVVYIHSSKYGEYYCGLTEADTQPLRLQTDRTGYRVSSGTNTITVSNLSPDKAYDLYVQAKAENGLLSERVKVTIPALK